MSPFLARWSRRALLGLAVAAALAAVALRAGAASAQPATPVYVAVDKAQLITLPQDPFTKVSVTNPNIADVHVVSPTQMLVNGKTAGVTSLVVFFRNSKVQSFDLVVHPALMVPAGSTPASPEPHSVLVQRGDRVTERLFIRDKGDLWIELGAVRLEADPAKK